MMVLPKSCRRRALFVNRYTHVVVRALAEPYCGASVARVVADVMRSYSQVGLGPERVVESTN